MALNQAAINIEVINGRIPALNYLKSLTVSSTSASSFLKRTGAIRKALSTSVATLVRGVRKRITYTSTSTASIRKAITQTARKVTSVSTASVVKRVGHLFSTVSSTSTATLKRVTGKVLTYNETAVSRLIKAVRKTFSVTGTSASNLYKRLPKSYSASSTAIVSLRKRVNKPLTSSIEFVVALVTGIATHFVSLVYNSVTTSSLRKLVRKLLTDIEVSVASIITVTNRLITLLAYSSSTVSIRKAATHALIATSTSVASVIKKVLKTFITLGTKTVMTGTLNSSVYNERTINSDDPTYTETTGITSTATIAVNSFYYKALTVLSTSISTIVRAITRLKVIVASVVTTTNSLVKQVGIQLYSFVENLADVFKQVQLVLITLGNKYVMTGTIGSTIYNLLTINTDDPVYTTTTGVSSTATVAVSTIYYRILTSIATVTSSLLPALIKLKVLVANAVTSTARVLKQVNLNLVSEVFNAIETVKQINLILITYGSKYVMTGGLNGLILNALTINEESPPSYILGEGVFSTATVSVLSNYYRTLNILSTSISSLLTFKFLPKVLVANVVSSIVSIKKDIEKLVEVAYSFVDATISTAITFLAELISLVTSTSTIASAKFFFKVLSVISTVLLQLVELGLKY